MKKQKQLFYVLLFVIFIFSCTSDRSDSSEDSLMVDEDAKGDVQQQEAEQQEAGQADKKSKTWKRSQKEINAVKLFIGDNEELPLKGTQFTVKIDGFRARVLIDCFFYGENDRQMEGTFKMRLPAGASPYFFAFGESVFLDKNKQQLPFNQNQRIDTINLSPLQIMQRRSANWTNPQEARVVPKEKASFAYSQTVRRKIDPLLAEWAGADIFNCKIFPILPGKMHRVVIGYDVNLSNIGNDKLFNLSIPKNESATIVDIDIAEISGTQLNIEPEIQAKKLKGRKHIHIENPENDEISVRYRNLGPVLISNNNEEEKYFAASFSANLPNTGKSGVYQNSVIAIDVSASSNPDKFNVWLKMLEALLNNNKDVIKKFKVMFFNIETFWWKNEYLQNTPENIAALMEFCNKLTLEGATDIGAAVTEACKQPEETAKNIFILSDGSATWGEDELYAVTNGVGKNNRIFAYNTGISGTDLNMLEHLSRESGGAVFSVAGEDEVAQASKAFRSEPWEIISTKMNKCSDLIIAGRPKYLYPGQQILISGRGGPPKGAELILELKQGAKKKKLKVSFKKRIETSMSKRVYGQIAVNQLESFDFHTEKFSITYATHFSVPGKTCSMLMLETEEDYQQYNIKTEENLFVINGNPVSQIVNNTLKNLGNLLGDAKATFLNQLKKLSNTSGVDFSIPTSLEMLFEKMKSIDFTVFPKPLNCKSKYKSDVSKEILSEIKNTKPDYDSFIKESVKRLKKYGAEDALKFMSTLIERNPSDGVMARDVAYSAMEWGLSEQAYYLFRRVIKSRPYEPQTYQAMAQILTKMNKIDLAVIYYEIALTANWDTRFGEFRTIAGLDYLRLLRLIKKGKYKVNFPDYINTRLVSLNNEFAKDKVDLMITISWNTDNTDIDLHVIEPSGEECFYSHPETKSGGKLTRDVTQGYGPEMYIIQNARKGKYKVKAKYYSSDRNRASTRTKVYAVIYENWGKANEKITKKVVSLVDNKDMHDIINLKIE